MFAVSGGKASCAKLQNINHPNNFFVINRKTGKSKPFAYQSE